MYNRSVWIEQVDLGLKNLISKVVKYENAEGVITPVTPTFPLLDMDLNEIELPTVLIRNLGYTFDMKRYDPNNTNIVVRTSSETNTATLESLAKPYTIHYQLDFLSEYKEDMNYMTMMWNSIIDKRHMLPVQDLNGESRLSYMHLVKDPQILNKESGDNKLFRTVMLYDIKVELDIGEETTRYIASKIDVGVNS